MAIDFHAYIEETFDQGKANPASPTRHVTNAAHHFHTSEAYISSRMRNGHREGQRLLPRIQAAFDKWLSTKETES